MVMVMIMVMVMVIVIVIDIFHHGRETRNFSLKSPRDKQQISFLARQINLGHVQEFMKSYEDATNRTHGYLMLDLTDPQLMTNID